MLQLHKEVAMLCEKGMTHTGIQSVTTLKSIHN